MDTLATVSSGGVMKIIMTTTPFAKFILFILLVFSVISWAIILRKWLFFRSVRRADASYRDRFRTRPGLLPFSRLAVRSAPSALPDILGAGLLEWNRLAGTINPQSTESAMSIVRAAMKRKTSEEVERYETALSFLATAGSASPFLGLLGTVWGIMKSFMDIRGLSTVTLQTVAPGIADALIVTAAGLVVAVPAVIFYNHYLGEVKDFENGMERFASEVESDLRKELLAPAKP